MFLTWTQCSLDDEVGKYMVGLRTLAIGVDLVCIGRVGTGIWVLYKNTILETSSIL